jgi:hypothetical protein
MRTTPASELKKQTRRRINSIPREGSRIRALYDLFHTNKGQVIDFAASTGNGRPMADLIEYYGLDIRRVARGRWVLAGEWFGRVYLDYVSEHLASEQEGIA